MQDYVIYGRRLQGNVETRPEIISIVKAKKPERTIEYKRAMNLLEIDVFHVMGVMTATTWNKEQPTKVYTTQL